jgi:hypothetical protein
VSAAAVNHRTVIGDSSAANDTRLGLLRLLHDAQQARDVIANELDDAQETYFVTRRQRRIVNSRMKDYEEKSTAAQRLVMELHGLVIWATKDADDARLAEVSPQYAQALLDFDNYMVGEPGEQNKRDEVEIAELNRQFDAAQAAVQECKRKLDLADEEVRNAERRAKTSEAPRDAAHDAEKASMVALRNAIFAAYGPAEAMALRLKAQAQEDSTPWKYYPTATS